MNRDRRQSSMAQGSAAGEGVTQGGERRREAAQGGERRSGAAQGGELQPEPLELYVHIPFCLQKCHYCDFLSFPAAGGLREQYVEKLTEEIAAAGRRFGQGYRVTSIFLGGGTPSILEPEQTGRILRAAGEAFGWERGAEVTTELNPGTVDRGKLRSYRSFGINRLSFGLQSADDRELESLGRIHNFRDFLTGYGLAREEGFENISLDLMSALPGQTMSSYRRTLKEAVRLGPEHISAYSLIIEEGTPFYERYGDRTAKKAAKTAGDSTGKRTAGAGDITAEAAAPFPALPGEEEERAMYHYTRAFLSAEGYERYEISNYARAGFECRHNLGYWTGTAYLGLGLGASSYIGGERFSAEPDLETYLNYTGEDFYGRAHHRERHTVTGKERMEEFMFLGLRLSRGIEESEFARRFGTDIGEIYGPVLEQFLREGLMERCCGSRLRLTEYGVDVSNSVLCEFLLD